MKQILCERPGPCLSSRLRCSSSRCWASCSLWAPHRDQEGSHVTRCSVRTGGSGWCGSRGRSSTRGWRPRAGTTVAWLQSPPPTSPESAPREAVESWGNPSDPEPAWAHRSCPSVPAADVMVSRSLCMGGRRPTSGALASCSGPCQSADGW